MIDVRCYEIKEGTFDGPIANRWVQIFIYWNSNEEYDTEKSYFYRFSDTDEELEGISVFAADLKLMSKVENIMKTRELVKKYAPQLILITEYNNQFLEIIKNSIEDQIPEIDYAITSEREMVHYALLKYNTSQVLLVAV